MARPARYRSRNIHLSILNRIGGTVTVGLVTYPVLHPYAFHDPEEARAPAANPRVAWLGTQWLMQKAGRGGVSLLQVDAYSRAEAPNDVDADPMGHRAERMMDEVEEIFIGVAGPGYNWSVEILDFDTAGFPFTGGYVMCQNTGGYFGVPEFRESMGLKAGLWRETMRLQFRTPRDTGHTAAFYTE